MREPGDLPTAPSMNWQGPTALMVLGWAAWALQPLHADLPVWAWSLMLMSTLWLGLAANRAKAVKAAKPVESKAAVPQGSGGDGAGAPCGAFQPLGGALKVAMVMVLTACLLDLIMGALHGQGFRTMRQDGKLLLSLLMASVWLRVLGSQLSGNWRPQTMAPAGSTSGQVLRTTGDLHTDLHAGLKWALVIQLIVALAVVSFWPRAQLPIGAVPWATLVALGLALLLPCVLEAWGAPNRHEGPMNLLMAALALALVAGLSAVVLSRSRAAWVIMPWVLVMIVAGSTRRWRTGLWVATTSLALLILGWTYDSAQPPQVERGIRLLDLIAELAAAAVQFPDPATSVGSRLVLWQAAWECLWANPWTGIGTNQRIELVQQAVPSSLNPLLPPLEHVHQQFLNQAVDHGLPGLLAAILSACSVFALAFMAPAGVLRQQLFGVALVHFTGLLFNANMTHGGYPAALGLAVMAAVILHATRSSDFSIPSRSN